MLKCQRLEVNQIAHWINWAANTVRKTIHSWVIKEGKGLWDHREVVEKELGKRQI